MYTNIYVFIHICPCINVHIYTSQIYIWISKYIYMHIHIHIYLRGGCTGPIRKIYRVLRKHNRFYLWEPTGLFKNPARPSSYSYFGCAARIYFSGCSRQILYVIFSKSTGSNNHVHTRNQSWTIWMGVYIYEFTCIHILMYIQIYICVYMYTFVMRISIVLLLENIWSNYIWNSLVFS